MIGRWLRLLICVALWGGFWIVAPFLNQDDAIAITSSLVFAVSIGVLFAYFGGARDILRAQRMTAANLLVAGIIVGWGSNVFRALWAWTFRYFDRPEWMQTSKIPAFMLWVLFTAGAFHLVASRVSDDPTAGAEPSGYMRYIGVVVAAATGVSMVLIYLTTASDFEAAREVVRILGGQR